MTSHTRLWKERQLAELKELAKKHPVLAVADISSFPAALFQVARKKLAGKAVVKVSKTKVIKKALKESGVSANLVEYAQKNCAVIFTDMNPFELFSFLKKNKGKVPAKAGAIAEEDISIPAGDTGLPPGPALSDLKGAGLKVAVQGATIAVMEDKVVTKKGEPVSAAVAGTLSKLNIKPFKVGMKLVAALEGVQIFTSEVLDVDTDAVFSGFVDAHRKAFNLAFNASIFTPQTTELLITKAFSNAKSVALEASIITSATVGQLLAKANAQANILKPLIKEIEAPKEEDKPAKAKPEPKKDAKEVSGENEGKRVGAENAEQKKEGNT